MTVLGKILIGLALNAFGYFLFAAAMCWTPDCLRIFHWEPVFMLLIFDVGFCGFELIERERKRKDITNG